MAAVPARAAEPLTLTWNAPAGCPSGDDVKAAALRAATHATESVEATANVEQLGADAWRVRLSMRGSERDIDAPTCAGVADATAVVLALALMPALTLEAPAPTTAPPAGTAPPAAALPPPANGAATLPSAAAGSSRSAHDFAAGLAGVGVLGALPNVAAGGALDLAWTPARFRVEAEGILLGPQSAHVAGKSEGARFHVAALSGRACYAVVRTAVFDASPCAGIGVMFAAADGFGADRSNLGATTTWGLVDAGALARAFVTRWLAVRLRAEADLPLARPRFVVDNPGSAPGVVFRLPTIGASAFLGAEVLFL